MIVEEHQQRLAPEQIEPVPDDLDSAQAKLVYLYLAATGGSTVEDLSRTLAMKKISVLSLLNALSSGGYVEQRDESYVVIG
ncbi:helix-turn-helix domain-containing protein [Halosolutus halophilus]|uniref:helix-turn-helix domain-containing protein n=1 Tax=Halosolutus halophilus TaxID=1552990 RepID=UPI0022350E6F|nr:helix-turn-helix domain-containing protein [Halosolutus halophilus]